MKLTHLRISHIFDLVSGSKSQYRMNKIYAFLAPIWRDLEFKKPSWKTELQIMAT